MSASIERTCPDCHGSGRCQHCGGRGYRGAPVAIVEYGSSGRGSPCDYCRPLGSGTCGTCYGRGRVEAYGESPPADPGKSQQNSPDSSEEPKKA